MAAFQKFPAFVGALANGVHNLSEDQIALALTDVAPSPLDSVLSNIVEIDYANLSSRDFTTIEFRQIGGTYQLSLWNLNLEATGLVGPFQYLVLFNSSTQDGNLIGFYEDAVSITLTRGGTYLVDFEGRPALTLA